MKEKKVTIEEFRINPSAVSKAVADGEMVTITKYSDILGVIIPWEYYIEIRPYIKQLISLDKSKVM
jgi:prevent-host-death family protein